jgi:hypothetical protein
MSLELIDRDMRGKAKANAEVAEDAKVRGGRTGNSKGFNAEGAEVAQRTRRGWADTLTHIRPLFRR